jgi:hypothetical protein
MTDKIAEIRTRHSKRSEIDQSGCYRLDGFTFMGSLSKSQEDVATLLAEVERLREDNERLRDVLQRVSVRPSGDSTVQIAFVSEGCTLTYPVCPQTTWALEAMIEFDKARRNALGGKP